MNKVFSRISLSGVLCGIIAFCFTAMSLLVQLGKLPSWSFLSAAALLGILSLWGLIRHWDWRAFFSASVLAGTAILSFATVTHSQPTPLEEEIGEKVKLALTALPVFWVLLAGFRLFLKNCRPRPQAASSPLAAALVVGGYTFAALCLSWIKYYPSGTSPDTRHQWGQIHGTLRLNDIHALGHTLYLKGLLAIWDDYAIAILVHILMISLLYGLFAHYFAGKGIPLGWMLLAVALFTACESPTRTYMYPWKDTPYTFALGILTLMLVYLLDSRIKFTWLKAVLTGISLAYAYLFRLNGIVVLLFIGIWLLVWYLKRRDFKRLLCTVLAAGICFAGVNFYGYGILKAESPKNGFSIQVFGSGLAAMVTQCGKELSAEERGEIAQILPVHWMIEYYEPWTTRKMIWTYETHDPEGIFDDPNMEIMVNNFVLALGEHRNEAIRLYFKLMPKHLAVCIRDVLYNTYQVWGFTSSEQFFYCNIFLLVLLMVGVGAVWKKKEITRRLIVFMPVILNAVSIAISTITNEERYLVPTFTLFPVLLLYLLASQPGPEDGSHDSAGETEALTTA